MAKIYFEGVVYDRADQMPADVRARYDKAVEMLPDRDANGVPDLLESDYTPGGSQPVGGAEKPGLPEPGEVLPPVVDAQTVRRVQKAARLARFGAAGIFFLVVGCIASILLLVMVLMRSSGAYQLAMEVATQHPKAIELLGAPIRAGILVNGSTSESGSSGEADLSIPVRGAQKSGTLQVSAYKQDDVWNLSYLILEVDGMSYDLTP